MVHNKDDEKYMRLSLGLARRGVGRTSPNPMVGAVVVKGTTIVGRGYHHRAGEPHAEVLALRRAGEKARGATLYLNLEPCDHFGRTPPCTRAILEAGIQRVVAGMKDPNPLVSGRGIRRLKRAGVKVEVGVLGEECRELNAPFCKYIETQTPLVTLKAAVSLDGKVATKSGDSRWISGEASRAYVHRLRSTMDAVMVGIGTVLKDDPLLNVRLPGVKNVHHPLRVIVDSRLRIPLCSQVVKTAGKYRTLVATTRAAFTSRIERLKKAHLEVIVVKSDANGRVDLRALMRELGRREILSILLEGGATLNASALREKVIDRMVIFMAPKIIGGEEAPGMIGGDGAARIRDAAPLKRLKIKRIGPDLRIEGVLFQNAECRVQNAE
ncbi:MAG: bifunctional diaminohydroxyphosphoribosylaminopyrimidine deaminase/5-amino-6-(5-phosphoribosylamino)uracil reductase RibD [Thermodesulfobacteriota bacterium]|jgi:diaminohydroxyphosphoribosylaminopyrimidine deaminase/5-amino-6-(5-phosphoribosylamino)uracil reductase